MRPLISHINACTNGLLGRDTTDGRPTRRWRNMEKDPRVDTGDFILEHGILANGHSSPSRLTRQGTTELAAVRITLGLGGRVCPSDLSHELIVEALVVRTGLGHRNVEISTDDDQNRRILMAAMAMRTGDLGMVRWWEMVGMSVSAEGVYPSCSAARIPLPYDGPGRRYPGSAPPSRPFQHTISFKCAVIPKDDLTLELERAAITWEMAS